MACFDLQREIKLNYGYFADLVYRTEPGFFVAINIEAQRLCQLSGQKKRKQASKCTNLAKNVSLIILKTSRKFRQKYGFEPKLHAYYMHMGQTPRPTLYIRVCTTYLFIGEDSLATVGKEAFLEIAPQKSSIR